MDKFVIEGGRKLQGTIRVNGAKNAALPMMAASLLLEQGDRLVLRNVPNLVDIRTMGTLLGKLGVQVSRTRDVLTMSVIDDTPVIAPYEIVKKMRASICVLGPLVGRRREAKVSQPGGCVIGDRPVDLHVRGLADLGVDITMKRGYLEADASNLKGRTVYIGGAYGPSVTGTQNMLLAARALVCWQPPLLRRLLRTCYVIRTS